MSTDIVDIGLAVDSSQVKNGGNDLDEFGRKAKKAKKATDVFADGLKKYATFAVVSAAIWKSIEAHREFTKSISELSAITGAVGNDLKFYKQQAMEMGRTTTFSASQVATAFKLVASAKPDLLDSKDALASVTREVLTLAEASGLTLPESAVALGSSLNQFGAGADQASRYINVLAAGAKFGASEINDTAMALKNAGSVAASVGLSFEETNAAIQMLASVSIKGGEAGTGLRGVLLKLSTKAKDEFNPEIVGLSKALENLKAANLSTTEKTKLFGQESVTAATALINQADSIDGLISKLTATDTAYKQAATNTDNLDGDIKSMSSAWEGAALMLGETFDPALRASTVLLKHLGNVASSIVIAIKDMGDALGSYAAQAVAVANFDWLQFETIRDARNAQRAENEKMLESIWAEKEVNAATTDAKIEDTKRDVEAVRVAAAEKRAIREAEAAAAAEKKLTETYGISTEDALSGGFDSDIEFEIARNDAKREEDAKHKALMLEQESEYLDELYALETGSRQSSFDFAKDLREGDLKGAMRSGQSALANAAKQSRAAFAIQKAMALANAVVTLPSAVLKSFDNGGGYPWGLIPAGLMLAQGAAQISAINSSTFGGGASTPKAAGGSAGGGGPRAPSAPSAGTGIDMGIGDQSTETRTIIGIPDDALVRPSMVVEILNKSAERNVKYELG